MNSCVFGGQATFLLVVQLMICSYTHAATFDRSGRHVITGSDDRLVKIWSMETAYCLASCRGHDVSILCPVNIFILFDQI